VRRLWVPSPHPAHVDGVTLAIPELSTEDKQALAAWTIDHAGGMTPDGGGRAFVPAAVRNLPVEHALKLARHPGYTRLWEARERERVTQSIYGPSRPTPSTTSKPTGSSSC
jgi:hypothetical protein